MSKAEITEIFGITEGTWVWCLHCERCYQVGEHRDGRDGLQYCHYEGCDGDAVMDAKEWSWVREGREDDPSYPEIPEHNKVYPLYG